MSKEKHKIEEIKMDKELKKNDWFTGHFCPTCNEEVWHKAGDEDFVCVGCESRYSFTPTNKKTQEENESVIKALWEKTVFPEKIKAFKEKKKTQAKQKQEEEKIISGIKAEAKKEALAELKPVIKENIKKQELDRLSGKRKDKNWAEKLADGFSMGGMTNKSDSNKKDIAGMMGMGSSNDNKKDIAGMMGMGSSESGISSNDKISQLLGTIRPGTERKQRGPKRRIKKKKNQTGLNAEEKIKRMLS